MLDDRAPLAVSIGDPAGIGPDIALTAWKRAADSSSHDPLPNFVLICDPIHLAARAADLNIDCPIQCMSEKELVGGPGPADGKLPVLPLGATFRASAGVANNKDAEGVLEAIQRAVELIRTNKARGMVTLPINKNSLYEAGFKHPGHTEFLGTLAQDWPNAEKPRPVMMLAGPDLRAVPVTIHIPLKKVPEVLTAELILETARITALDLKNRFGIDKPRLAVSGLNPHAGESGTMGEEDEAIIAPAVEQLRSEGIDCRGPLPADTMFHATARASYDAALCMYHDQALIPAKALAFDETVNVTLGLPFVRTSPDHGTAFDIAGTGKASPASFIAALHMADAMTKAGGVKQR